MRNSIFSLIIFFVFSGIFYYLLHVVSPWNETLINEDIKRFGLLTDSEFHDFIKVAISNGTIFKLLNYKNLLILGFVGATTLISGFSALHLFIDKLFFKKFYERPSLAIAIRRGVLLTLLVFEFVFLRLNGALKNYIGISSIVLVILIEILILIFIQKHTKSKVTDNSDSNKVEEIGEDRVLK